MMADGEHIDKRGTIRWYKNGNLHREDGPAIMYTDGEEQWYTNGVLHREDGPAVIYGKVVYFYLAGMYYTDVKDFANDAGWSDKQLAYWLLRY